jgi:hypothetical protein
MSRKPKTRNETSDYESELKIAHGLDLICTPPCDPGMERLNALKEQLRTLYLRLERRELCPVDPKAQSMRIQEELSKLIWTLEDWQIQFASRN